MWRYLCSGPHYYAVNNQFDKLGIEPSLLPAPRLCYPTELKPRTNLSEVIQVSWSQASVVIVI